MTPDTTPRIVDDPSGIAAAARALEGARRIAFDLESNGLFAFRASICTLQLADDGGPAIIVDARATSIAPLGALLGEAGPLKVVHDVSFDARMLGEVGIALGNVHDTSIAARMLGRTSTGLATLLASELGITVDKALQHHDWAQRPLEPPHVAYLARDVAHLSALDDHLWALVRAAGIEDEVLEETRYRLASAVAAATSPDPQPAYTKLKGIDRSGRPELAIVRRLVEARDEEAARLDVPPYKVLGAELIIAIAKARPGARADLARIRGATQGRAVPMAAAILRAVAAGIADGDVPEEDRAWLTPVRLPSDVARARRAREARLMAWRKGEAARRGVDEQVVLPGHCVKDLAENERIDAAAIAAIKGFGACRARYVDAIALALRGESNDNASG